MEQERYRLIEIGFKLFSRAPCSETKIVSSFGGHGEQLVTPNPPPLDLYFHLPENLYENVNVYEYKTFWMHWFDSTRSILQFKLVRFFLDVLIEDQPFIP